MASLSSETRDGALSVKAVVAGERKAKGGNLLKGFALALSLEDVVPWEGGGWVGDV